MTSFIPIPEKRGTGRRTRRRGKEVGEAFANKAN